MALKLRRTSASRVKLLSTFIAVFALLAQPMYGFVASQVANAAPATHVELQAAIDEGGSVEVTGPATLGEQLRIHNKNVTINGNDNVVTPTYTATVSGDGDNVIVITGNSNVTINNLVVDGAGKSGLQGIQVHDNSIVTLNNVTVRNNAKAGIHVNGNSKVTVNNVTTANNGSSFGGIVVSANGHLTINGQSRHTSELISQVRRNSGTVVDTHSQYSSTNLIFFVRYTLRPAPAAPSFQSPTPANNSTITDDANVTIRWSNIAAANSYEYRINSGAEVSTSDQSFTQSFANGTYTVQVRSVAASGLTGNWNTARTFTVNVYNYNAADSWFIGNDKYTRVNSAGDLASQVRVPVEATDARFTFSGPVTIENVVGYEHLQTNQWPQPSTGAHQYRVGQALPVGVYDVTAEYQAAGAWYAVTGTHKLYVLASPVFDITYPNDTRHIFRPDDSTIVRIRANDTNESFGRVEFTISGTTFTVHRAACDLRQAGNYVICDVTKAANWTPLAAGTYTATAKVLNRANGHTTQTSRNLIIDDAAPVVTDLEAPAVAGASVTVSAEVADDNGVKQVRFYLASPDAAGACKNNLSAIISEQGIHSGSGTYTAVIDTSGLNGVYCVLVSAEDVAAHNSTPLFKVVTLDNIPPVVTFDGYAGTSATPTLTGKSDAGEVKIVINDRTAVTVPVVNGLWSYTVTAPLIRDVPNLITVTSTDEAGNVGTTDAFDEFGSPVRKVFVINAPYVSKPADTIAPVPGLNPSRSLAALFSTPSVTTVAASASEAADEDVLGARDTKTASPEKTVAVIEPSVQGWKLFGFAWFWWVLLGAAVAAGWWMIAAARRRRDENAY